MNKLQFIVLFISNHLKQVVHNFYRPALYLGPVFFSLTAFSSTKIALIDTGFCPLKSSQAIVHPSVDLTQSVVIDCQKISKDSPRLHGQRVMSEFLKFLNVKNQSVEIFPLIIFDQKGLQKKDYWLKAIQWVSDNKIDLVLTAAGFISNAQEIQTLPQTLPAFWFVPSGRIGPGVSAQTILYPQGIAPKANLVLVGDYYEGKVILSDDGLLYKDKIDYYFPNGKAPFTGTSRAVAEAAARALNACPPASMRSCLPKLSKTYYDGISRKPIKTY